MLVALWLILVLLVNLGVARFELITGVAVVLLIVLMTAVVLLLVVVESTALLEAVFAAAVAVAAL